MSCRVVLQRLARQDLEEAYLRASENAPQTAARWLDRFQAALQSLTSNPERCVMASILRIRRAQRRFFTRIEIDEAQQSGE